MPRRPRITIVVLAALAALALGACSSASSSPAPASVAPASVAPASVAPAPSEAAPSAAAPSAAATACQVGGSGGTAAEIKGFAFPTGLSVDAGSAISWTNGDSAPHTVTFDDGSCDTRVEPGATVTVTYGVAGTYTFHCTVHPNMKGSLEVKG